MDKSCASVRGKRLRLTLYKPSPEGGLSVVTPTRTPCNAPATPTYYLGRDRDLFCLVDAMLRHRLTTVAGSFGCGKSALAAAAASYVAERGSHFDACVWVKVATRDRLVDDVVEATRRVITSQGRDHTREEVFRKRRVFSRGSSIDQPSLQPHAWAHALASGTPTDAASFVSGGSSASSIDATSKATSFSALHGGAKAIGLDARDDDEDVAQKNAAALFLREKRVLVVLDDFEKLLVATPKVALRARFECQRALASLLAATSKARVVLTCSKGSGLGRSTSVTERVIKLKPLDARAAARLLLHRSPELARRATNVNAARGPRVPPESLVSAVAIHPVLRRLAGNPFAIALSATLLNSLFESEEAAETAARNAAKAEKSSKENAVNDNDRFLGFLLRPSNSSGQVFSTQQEGQEDPLLEKPDLAQNRSRSSPNPPTAPQLRDPLEPLDRLYSLLTSVASASSPDDAEDDPDLRLRDEINFVVTRQESPGDLLPLSLVNANHTHDDDSFYYATQWGQCPVSSSNRRQSSTTKQPRSPPSEEVVTDGDDDSASTAAVSSSSPRGHQRLVSAQGVTKEAAGTTVTATDMPRRRRRRLPPPEDDEADEQAQMLPTHHGDSSLGLTSPRSTSTTTPLVVVGRTATTTNALVKNRALDRRTFDALAAAVFLAWLSRLVLDALRDPVRAFSLRIDAVAHLFVDVAILVVLATYLPDDLGGQNVSPSSNNNTASSSGAEAAALATSSASEEELLLEDEGGASPSAVSVTTSASTTGLPRSSHRRPARGSNSSSSGSRLHQHLHVQ